MRKSKTIACGVLALVLLGVVQMAGASSVKVECKPGVKSGSPECNEMAPSTPQLAARVLPASPKAVTRFSAGASHLRQQVQIQTQGHHAP